MLFKAVLAQSAVILSLFSYTVLGASKLECTGDAQACASIQSGTPGLVIGSIIALAVFYLMLSLLAYFANKTRSKIALIILIILEALILVSAVGSVFSAENVIAKVMHTLAFVFAGLIFFLCAKRLKNRNLQQD